MIYILLFWHVFYVVFWFAVLLVHILLVWRVFSVVFWFVGLFWFIYVSFDICVDLAGYQSGFLILKERMLAEIQRLDDPNNATAVVRVCVRERERQRVCVSVSVSVSVCVIQTLEDLILPRLWYV